MIYTIVYQPFHKAKKILGLRVTSPAGEGFKAILV
jgi:hypothetical protein